MEWFPPPPGQEKPPEAPQQPPWLGPSGNELGVAVPIRLILARSAKAAVIIGEVVGYRTGFELGVSLRLRHPEQAMRWGTGAVRPGQPLPADVFRLGVEFADGRRGTTLAGAGAVMRARAEGRAVRDPEGPLISSRGGSGSDRRFDSRYWVWPLPPPARLTLACEWPAYGIGLTTTELDAGPIIEAGSRSGSVWEEGEAPPGGGRAVSSRGLF